ncbi:hypothetical protein Pfo_002104, partial [Paulownia fortunei]
MIKKGEKEKPARARFSGEHSRKNAVGRGFDSFLEAGAPHACWPLWGSYLRLRWVQKDIIIDTNIRIECELLVHRIYMETELGRMSISPKIISGLMASGNL